jgi:hypothetical protein
MPGDDWWFRFPDELSVRQEPDGRRYQAAGPSLLE